MEQAISSFDTCGCNCGTTKYLPLGNGEDGVITTSSFPLQVFSSTGAFLGIALNKQELINLWNSDADDQALGTLGDMIGDHSFQLCAITEDLLSSIRVADADLAFKWNSVDNSRSIGITMDEDETDDITIYWGDGTFDIVAIADLGDPVAHDYARGGRYEVKVFAGIHSIIGLDVTGLDLEDFVAGIFPDTLETLVVDNNNLQSLELPSLASLTSLSLHDNQLKNFNAANIPAGVIDLDIGNNFLSSATVDAILQKLDTLGLSDGDVDLTDQSPNAVPGTSGQAAKTSLEGKGWTVNVDV